MSSINDFEERFPDDRKKLDGFRNGSAQDTQHSETNSTFCIRKSLAWDSAFFTSPGVLEPEELLQTLSSGVTCNAVNLLSNEEEILLPSESLEPERARKNDSCSFRKSLAWDNAFYTSQGVLDPEELSLVNKGFKRCAKYPKSKVWRSSESISTIDSCSSLASLEFELFEDKGPPVRKLASIKLKRASKKTDASSRVRMKAIPMSQRQSFNVLRPERNIKEVSVSSKGQLAAGTGKLLPSESLKPQKMSSRNNHTSTAATKGSSLDRNYVKMGSAKDASGKSLSLSKKPFLGGSSNMTHGSTPSLKSYSSGSPATTLGSTASSHCEGFPIEDTSGESPISFRTKVDCSLENFATNGLIINTSSTLAMTNKDELESSSLTPKSTSYSSSASSLDGWSSESPSTSSVRQSSISRQVSFGSDTTKASDTEIKPSGLRVPSPKIGFFDRETTLVKTNGSMQFHSGVPSSMEPRNGAVSQYGKLKPPRNLAGKKNVQKVLKRMNKEPNKENEDPNKHYFKDQIEGLTDQVGAINLGRT